MNYYHPSPTITYIVSTDSFCHTLHILPLIRYIIFSPQKPFTFIHKLYYFSNIYKTHPNIQHSSLSSQCNTNGSSRVPLPLQALLVREDSLRLPFLYPRLLRRDRLSHVGSVLTLTLCLVADDFVTAFLANFLLLLFIPLRLL